MNDQDKEDFFPLFKDLNLPVPIQDYQDYMQTKIVLNDFAFEHNSKFNSALNAFSIGNYKKAESILLKCLNNCPNDFGTLALLVEVLNGLKKYKKADEMFVRACAIVPDDPFLIKNYISHLQHRREKQKAEKLMQGLVDDYWFLELELSANYASLPEKYKIKLENSSFYDIE